MFLVGALFAARAAVLSALLLREGAAPVEALHEEVVEPVAKAA